MSGRRDEDDEPRKKKGGIVAKKSYPERPSESGVFMMTDEMIEKLSIKVAKTIAKKGWAPAKAMWASVLALVTCTAFIVNALSEDSVHEADQDRKISTIMKRSEQNYNAILDLSLLHIAQSRYQQSMDMAAAPPGTVFPPRPADLIKAEQKLFQRRSR